MTYYDNVPLVDGNGDTYYPQTKINSVFNDDGTETLDSILADVNLQLDALTGVGSGTGDMLMSIYDTDGDGIVDNADKLDGKHASDFVSIFANSGNADFNTLLKTGFYQVQGANPLNSPIIGDQHFHVLVIWHMDTWVKQIAYDVRTQNTYIRTNIGGTWQPWVKEWNSGNDGSGSGLDADLWDGFQAGTRTNWSTNNVKDLVVGQLGWKNYGNNHTIFDASQGTSPDGTAISSVNSQFAWGGTFPTLMGWNGASTYGVRVDSARVADSFINSDNGTIIFAPKGGIRAFDNGTETGFLKITLPVTWTNTMLKICVDIYDYSTGESFTAYVSGYNHGSGSWINCTGYIVGNNITRNLTIRFGHDGTKCAIYIGESTSTWDYMQIVIKDVFLGYSAYSPITWSSGWVVGITPTLGTITYTVTGTLVGAKVFQTTIPTSLADGIVCYVYE